jgi:hypothetical protein
VQLMRSSGHTWRHPATCWKCLLSGRSRVRVALGAQVKRIFSLLYSSLGSQPGSQSPRCKPLPAGRQLNQTSSVLASRALEQSEPRELAAMQRQHALLWLAAAPWVSRATDPCRLCAPLSEGCFVEGDAHIRVPGPCCGRSRRPRRAPGGGPGLGWLASWRWRRPRSAGTPTSWC